MNLFLEHLPSKERDMHIRLPFFDRIKAFLKGRISDRNFALNRNRTYEIEFTPDSLRSEKRPTQALGKNAIQSAKIGATPVSSVNVVRPWFAYRAKDGDKKQTPSNLG